MSKNFSYPAMLSYRSSISPSLFAFYSLENGENKNIAALDVNILHPIQVDKSILRTTLANYIEASKLEAELEKGGANIQTVEKATLPPNSDTLIIIGNVKFYGNSLAPEATNENDFIPYAKEYIDLYKQKIGYGFLAERYFMNLINGKILWRNQYGKVQTFLKTEQNQEVFDLDKDIDSSNPLSISSIQNIAKKEIAIKIIKEIENALNGGVYLTLQVVAKVVLGEHQIVYPSQEFDEQKKISRVLAKSIYRKGNETIQQAIFHEQKIGNAIRTIDTWYSDDTNNIPLPVEPYGISQKESIAKRINKNSFYDYFTKLDKLIFELKSEIFDVNKHHYIVACLIRGGVYSGGKKNTDKNITSENGDNLNEKLY